MQASHAAKISPQAAKLLAVHPARAQDRLVERGPDGRVELVERPLQGLGGHPNVRRPDAVEPLAQVQHPGEAAVADLLDDRSHGRERVLDVDLRPRDDATEGPGAQGLATQVESAHHDSKSRWRAYRAGTAGPTVRIMSIAGPPGAFPRLWRAPRPVLPAPTPDEAAAVRARVEARRQPVLRSGRRAATVAAVVAAAVAFVALLVLDLWRDGDGVRWAPLLACSVLILVARERVTQCRRADDAVRSRLTGSSAGGSGSSAPPRWARADVVAACLGATALAAGLLGVVVRSAGRGPVDLAFAGGIVLMAALGLLGVRSAAVAPPVGDDAVLRAVDDALRRRDVLAASVPVWWVTFFAASWSRPGDGWRLVQLGGMLLVVAALGIAAYVRDDGWLLRDYRIWSAPAPSTWLSRT